MMRVHFVVVILILTGTACFAQSPDLLGIGLSGSANILDSLVQDGDSVYTIVSFDSEPEWPVGGIGWDAGSLNQIRLHVYIPFVPADSAVQSYTVTIDPASVIIDSLSLIRTVRFRFLLPPIVNPNVHSLQLEAALWARNTDGDIVFSDRSTSHVSVGSVRPLGNPVDDTHSTYLRFIDTRTYPPILFLPAPGGIVAASFQVRYSQPEQALAGSLILALRNEATDSTTRIYLRDRAPGALKIVPLAAASLRNFTYMDSLQGPTALAQGGLYTFTLSYQDLNTNRPDSAEAAGVRVDRLTDSPVIIAPVRDAILPRYFEVRYSQPEQAAFGSLRLSFVRLDALETQRVIYLRDVGPASLKIVTIDALNLNNPDYADSLSGPASLSHNANYRIAVVYTDTLRNAASGDSIEPVYARLVAEPPSLYEPDIGTSRQDSTVPVLYYLPQEADTVWLMFEADSLSPVPDTLSPHILRLASAHLTQGLHNFQLDGRNIGTNSPFVEESNRGAEDRLVSQCVYYVTLTHGDTLGNENVSAMNYGYVWPDDRTTVPARMTEPRSGDRENETFRVAFTLFEDPLPGSVYIRISQFADTNDPAGTHLIYLEDIPRGTTAFYLNARDFLHSDLVDTVTGEGTPEENNRLVDSVRYFVRVYYRDYLANPEALSNAPVIRYDNHTTAVTILDPMAGDTLERLNLVVRFRQPEQALGGTTQVIFTQTSGYTTDLGSPHILFVSDSSANMDTGKVVVVQPLALYSSSGIDSIRGGSELLIRSTYSMSILYKDTLDNPYSTALVDNLVYSSGAVVYIRGAELGSGQVLPGEIRSSAFWLALRATETESILQALTFHPFGTAAVSDLISRQVSLWQSVDTVFSEAEDDLLDQLSGWNGGDMIFDSLAVTIGETETHLLVTLAFDPAADVTHSIHLQLAGAASVDCGTDPVIATSWPIGRPDVPLEVELTSYGTEQDTLFGALRVWWVVASERDNAGFILLRRAETDSVFTPIANYATSPELVGRGYDPTAARYQFIDRGLTPGQRYFYRIKAVSFSFYEYEFDAILEGIPRIPPQNFILGDAYPNPFNQDVAFSYVVPYPAEVRIAVYDLLGRHVKTLTHRLLAPAEYRARWDSRTEGGGLVSSGVYFYRMEAAGTFNKTRKMILIR